MAEFKTSNNPSNILTDADWDALGDTLEAFAVAWENAPPAPRIAEFVRGLDPNQRYLTLVELIKMDLEIRAADPNTRLSLEHYRDEWPELCQDGKMPADLVYEELQLRRRTQGDEALDIAGPASMFPGGIRALTQLVNNDPYKSTALFRARRSVQLKPGDRIDDFDLLLKLGAGAFATVFLARQNSMQRLVALKISSDQGFEPQTLAQLDHPHIVRVYDHRVAEDGDLRLMYMQYVPGASLVEVHRELKKQPGPPDGNALLRVVDQFLVDKGESAPVQSLNRRWLKNRDWGKTVCRIGQQIASALAYAHARNVLHRDLKPANVLIDADCNVKLVDFNVSFCSKLDGVSAASFFGGSLGYMSPEQLEACSPAHPRTPDELDGKSDVYSLGILLYELLTGNRPGEECANPEHPVDVPGAMIQRRRAGLTDADRDALENQPRMLAQLIRRSLDPDETNRPDADAASRWLQWAGLPGVDQYLASEPTLLRKLAERWSIAIACLLTVSISAVAALFITTYNLMESVPAQSQVFFQTTVGVVNALLFTIGGGIICWLMLPVASAMKKLKQVVPLKDTELLKASDRNWHAGHLISVMCVAEWSLAGIAYPAILSLNQVALTQTGWFDFLSSHLITGLIAGAFTFWSITYFSLRYWHPRFLMAGLEQGNSIHIQVDAQKMRRRIGIYQVIAVAMPLMGIAWLIWWGHGDNRFAMGIVTLVALIGLGFLVWVVQQIQGLMQIFIGLGQSSTE